MIFWFQKFAPKIMMCLAAELSLTQKTGYFCEKTGYFWSFFFCLQILWFYTSVIVAWGLINPLFYEVHPILLTNPSPSFFFKTPPFNAVIVALFLWLNVSNYDCTKNYNIVFGSSVMTQDKPKSCFGPI